MPSPRREIGQGPAHGGRQDQVVPPDFRFDPPGQPFQPGRVLGAYAPAEVVGTDSPIAQLG